MATLVVTASVLNVRSGPGRDHLVLTRVPEGARLEERGVSDDGRWRRVSCRLSDGVVEGWVSARYVTAGWETADATPAPPWLSRAESEIGVTEYPGPDDNPRIVEYHGATALRAADDEVPWCSSFLNWCMTQAGVRGTGSAAARSWLPWGRPLPEPRRGCVAVFRRGSNPASGHVALYVRSRGALVDVLGGNQSNQVRISGYPAASLLGYRWPAGWPV